VHAVVLPKAGQLLTEADIIAHCRARIAGYKCPKSVEIADGPLPRSGANKILKSKLRAAFRPEAP
jgi:long-chain acyl-CoA synthetase